MQGAERRLKDVASGKTVPSHVRMKALCFHLNAVQEAERRLKDVVSGKKPAGLGNGMSMQPGKKSAVPTKAPTTGRQVC